MNPVGRPRLDYSSGKKYCSECKKDKPLSEFYFIEKSNSYVSKCKECTRELAKTIYSRSNSRYTNILVNIELQKMVNNVAELHRKDFIDALGYILDRYETVTIEKGTQPSSIRLIVK